MWRAYRSTEIQGGQYYGEMMRKDGIGRAQVWRDHKRGGWENTKVRENLGWGEVRRGMRWEEHGKV